MKSRKLIFGILLASVLGISACTIPAWVNTVGSDAEVAVPIAASLIGVIDPALAPLVSAIKAGFDALTKTLDGFKSAPTDSNLQAVQSAFAAVNSNVAELESAAHIKNAATKTTVTAVVQLLTQVITEIAAQVPASVNSKTKIQDTRMAAKRPLTVTGQAKGWKAGDFKREFNKIVKDDARFRKL
jgi:hypothetical protein